MKILHVITSLQYGGAEKLVADIVPMLKDKGNDIDVVAFDNSEPNFSKLLEDKGIKVIFWGKGYYSLKFLFRLGKMMKDYDIVHTHNTSPQYFAAIANLWNNNCKLVTTEHNTSNRRRGHKILSYIDRWMYNKYQYIICISNKTEEKLKEFIGKVKSPISTIYNGISINEYRQATNLEIKPSRTVITMVGAFRLQKDQDTIVRAMSILDKEKYEVWLVGEGERKKIVEDLSKELHLNNNVRFLGLRKDVPSILKTSDIVVMSSHWEGFGLAAVEGMAAGKPVIATDIPGLAQIVEGAGILFPHSDDKTLASEIVRLAEDKEYYQQIANKCWERAQMFDIKEMVNGYHKVYEEVMNEK